MALSDQYEDSFSDDDSQDDSYSDYSSKAKAPRKGGKVSFNGLSSLVRLIPLIQ